MVRERSELEAFGVRYQIRPGHWDFPDETTLSLSIDCPGTGPVVLHIPAGRRRVPDFMHPTKRRILESLITQLNNQLAVEALEGR